MNWMDGACAILLSFSSSTTRLKTSTSSRGDSTRRATKSRLARDGEEALARVKDIAARPDPARRHDAEARRNRDRPAAQG